MKLTSRQIFRERRGIAVQYLKNKMYTHIFGTGCKIITYPSNLCLRQRPYFFSLVYFPACVTHTLQLGVRLFSLVLRQHKCSHLEFLFLVGCRSAGLFRSCVNEIGLESTKRSAESGLCWLVCAFVPINPGRYLHPAPILMPAHQVLSP